MRNETEHRHRNQKEANPFPSVQLNGRDGDQPDQRDAQYLADTRTGFEPQTTDLGIQNVRDRYGQKKKASKRSLCSPRPTVIASVEMTEALIGEPDIDIDLVKEWARQAGEIALRYFNRVDGSRKPDRSLVTDADHEIEDLLTGCLRATYPEHGVIGEEGTKEIHGENIWAIDPLDGTRSFLAGLPVWGTSIGLLRQGRPWLGVFYMPLLDDWYYSASPATGAFWNGRPIRCPARDDWDEDSLLCLPADVHRQYDITFAGITRALGSGVAHLCYVARGNAVAVLLHNPGIWDIAAGAAILQAAGGTLRYLAGGEVQMEALLEEGTAQNPMLAAHPALIDRLAPHIKPRTTL